MNCSCCEDYRICQSCAMPMQGCKDCGTEADKSQSCDYCMYCYSEGKFLNPDITLDQMSNKLVEMMEEKNVPQDIIDQVKDLLPTLKRWAKK